MRWVLRAVLALLAVGTFGQTAPLIPLAVTSATGRTYDSRDGQTLSGVLVGFLIPSTGPITSVAPLISDVNGDGTLAKNTVGPWAGASSTKPLRIEKPGYAVAGLRALVTVAGKTVRTRQFQVLWKAWGNDQMTGNVVESRVYGEAAGAQENTKVVELRLTSLMGGLGIYGIVDDTVLAEFSLVQRPSPLPVSTPAAAGPSGPAAPTALTIRAPTMPIVPEPDPLLLKR